MTNPTQRDSAARKVVAVARQIVTYQIGLPNGCLRMQRVWSPILNSESELISVFSQYMNESLGLPLGSERLHWDRTSLRNKDEALERLNAKYRDQIFDACWEIIDHFAQAAADDPKEPSS